MYTTNAEASRQTEMCMIYNEAWRNAKRGIPLAGEEAVGVENPQNSFDAKGIAGNEFYGFISPISHSLTSQSRHPWHSGRLGNRGATSKT